VAKKKRKLKSGTLSDSLIYSARLYRTHLTRSLSNLGLHTGQDALLKCLIAKNGQTMGELAKQLAVRPPTVTKMVSRMCAQHLIRRANSQDDNRVSHVFITEQGASLLKNIKKTRKAAEKLAFAGRSRKNRHRLNRLLLKVSRNLEKNLKKSQKPQ